MNVYADKAVHRLFLFQKKSKTLDQDERITKLRQKRSIQSLMLLIVSNPFTRDHTSLFY